MQIEKKSYEIRRTYKSKSYNSIPIELPHLYQFYVIFSLFPGCMQLEEIGSKQKCVCVCVYE